MRPDAAPLKLRAEDADDLAVISACLQDALVPVRDLAYERAARRFMFVANRFCWERDSGGDGVPRFERTLCGIAFDEVNGVVFRGFQRSDEDRILCLLAIRSGEMPGGGPIDLEFAAGATIRLQVGAIRGRARDLGEPWPTAWLPDHPETLP